MEPIAHTLRRLENFWKDIRADADERVHATLRVGANIVGFRHFPMGWSWTEYPLAANEKPRPYEETASKVRLFQTPRSTSRSQLGIEASLRGNLFRKSVAEATLKKLIRLRKVQTYLITPSASIVALSDGEKTSNFDLDVNSSSITLFGGETYDCLLNAPDLVDAVASMHPWATKAKVNWLLIEAYLRSLFEAGGLPAGQQQYLEKLAEWMATWPTETHPARSDLWKRIAALRSEYSNANNPGEASYPASSKSNASKRSDPV